MLFRGTMPIGEARTIEIRAHDSRFLALAADVVEK
jgi:hypothetical protein